MDNNTQQSSPQHCVGCQQFYGNPANENLCSSCYKMKLLKNNAPPQAQTQANLNNQSKSNLDSEKQSETEKTTINSIEEIKQVEQSPVQELQKKPIQTDIKKCWNCSKKVGLLGVKCKCEYVFCNKHRMPEDHQCDFNFALEGKQQLTIANPLVQKPKLEKI